MNLQLSLKTKWFEMTKASIKTEDYREITPYWKKRISSICFYAEADYHESEFINGEHVDVFYKFKEFSINTMTLGYPKSTDTSRILHLEHKGIEIRTGNPEWGAEPGRLYFVIKHGGIIK